MCTVSYIPAADGIIITSSRDESINRVNTLPPRRYGAGDTAAIFPTDEKSGGTWIGINKQPCAAVLLNGAFTKHRHQPPYMQSRGLIIPAMLQAADAVTALESMSLTGTEPFTIILYCNEQLFEYRWDGELLHKKQLAADRCYLWNSVTLYTQKAADDNSRQLATACAAGITEQDMMKFHFSKRYELQLPQQSRANNISTISITQIVLYRHAASITYHDLSNETVHHAGIQYSGKNTEQTITG